MLSRRFLALAVLVLPASTAGGDEINRIEGETIERLLKSPDSRPLARMSVAEIAGLPGVLHDSRAALLVARTDGGNLARMLVSVALASPRVGTASRSRSSSWSDSTPSRPVGWPMTGEGGTWSSSTASGSTSTPARSCPKGRGGPPVPGHGRETGTWSRWGPPGSMAARQAPRGTRRDRIGRADSGTDGRPRRLRGAVPPLRQRALVGRTRAEGGRGGGGLGRVPLRPGRDRLSGHRAGGGRRPAQGRLPGDTSAVRQDFEGLLWAEGKGAMAGTMTMLDHPTASSHSAKGDASPPRTSTSGRCRRPDERGSPGAGPSRSVRIARSSMGKPSAVPRSRKD